MNKKQREKLQEAYSIICEIVNEEEDKLLKIVCPQSIIEEKFSETEKYKEMEESTNILQEIIDLMETLDM